jgi:CheY-like chemotaxis protein
MSNVMIVDDDESMRSLLEAILRREGYEAFSVPGGAQALDCLRNSPPPDLMLLDLMMPGMSGWQVLEALHENPRLADVPVVVLTAFGSGDCAPAERPVIHKPVDADVLCGLVDELLSQRRRLTFSLTEPPSDLLPRRTVPPVAGGAD